MGRRGFDAMRSPRAATMIALASATGHARTLPAIRTGAGEMMPSSMHLLIPGEDEQPAGPMCGAGGLGGAQHCAVGLVISRDKPHLCLLEVLAELPARLLRERRTLRVVK